MKNEELLQDAIGMIGDDLIADADYIDDTDRRPRRPRVIRWSAVACACLALIVAVSVGWLWRGDEPGVEPPDHHPDAYVYCVGETCVSSYGTILYQAYEDGKITLIFDKTDEREVYWFLSGNDIKDEWLDEYGKPGYDLDHYYATNKPDYSERGTRVTDGLVFIVNGEKTTVFPTAPGHYEIVIDYTKLFSLCNEMDPYIHGSIGAFYIGKYAFIE